MRAHATVAALALVVGLAGCSEDTPRKDYDDYRARTADRRANACVPMGPPESRFADVRGRWFVYALLATGIELGLRVELSGDTSEAPNDLQARFWLDRADPDVDPPLTVVMTRVHEDGTFVLVADLALPPELLGGDTTVLASVVLAVSTLSEHAWCGDATGNVTSPIVIDLMGSTFFATRDEVDALQKGDIPFQCPRVECVDEPSSDSGPTGDGGPPLDGGVPRPAAPDLSDVASTRRDLTGHYLMHARLAGAIALKLWVSMLYAEATDADGRVAAFVEGSLRRATDLPGSTPLITFSTPVAADGRFDIWLPGLMLDSPLGPVNADILLTSATLPVGFCGRAAGTVRSPITLDLANTNFAMTPWAPGTPLPDPLPNSCETAMTLVEPPPVADSGVADSGAADGGAADGGVADGGSPDAG